MMRFTEKLRQFLYGRYGADTLGYTLIGTALILSLLAAITRQPLLDLLGTVLLVISLYRTFSRQIVRRQQENFWFLSQIRKIRNWWQSLSNQFAQRKTHRFFRCPRCGQKVRVPKGRGKIVITCPVCRDEFVRKT